MYRVLILSLLAIATLSFAIDSSNTILQAKSIADTNVTLQWSPIEWATHYKVFYDQTLLLKNDGSNPVYDSEVVTKTEVQIRDLAPVTEYTFFAHWFDKNDKEVGVSIPVHVKTFQSSKFMISGDPVIKDEKTVQISFTRPIDVKKTQITLTNSKNKSALAIDHIENSTEDLRIIFVVLKKKLEIGWSYDITFKKVTTQAGTELAAENKTTLKLAYTGNSDAPVIVPPAAPGSESPDVGGNDVVEQRDITEPVPIDKLPQTGPEELFILLGVALLVAFFLQKKLQKGA